MSAAEQAVRLFEAGVSVREIGDMAGLGRAAVTETPTHFAQCPKYSGTTIRVMRMCPFFNNCRDCTFQGCVLDKFREAAV